MDEYYLANEKLINEDWEKHYQELEDDFSGMSKYKK